ncbi:MAG: cation diffusion facilitator family transporter [Acidobacteriota bacterium]
MEHTHEHYHTGFSHAQEHHEHSHHHHHHVHDTSGSRLLMTLALNFIIPVAQIIGGIKANSMALISDATHNFSDFTAVLIAYIANRIAKRGASADNTFGYRRVEILAAVLNVGILLLASAFIIYAAIQRIYHPEAVFGRLVALIAGIGVIGNGLSAWLLHKDASHNLNVRGAFLHMLGDLFTSVVVVLNGIVLIYKPWYWIDPALSVLIVIFIARNCWTILKEATAILMNSTPATIDIHEVKAFLERIPGIVGAHYLHAWNLCSSSIGFSCHIVVPDQRLSEIDALSEKIRGQLYHAFKIDHPVLQFETVACGDGGTFCEMSCASSAPDDSCRCEEPSGSSRGPVLFNKPLYFWVRIILGVIFIAASVGKIIDPEGFAKSIHNYQIIPESLINLTAIVLPWLELILGVFLVLGFWTYGSVVISNLLLGVFFAALAFNTARGINVHCGCFITSATGDPETAWYFLRDSIFLLLSGSLLFDHFRRRKATVEEQTERV